MTLDPEYRDQQPADRFDPRVHVTARELRAGRVIIRNSIPDSAWVPRADVRTRVVGIEAPDEPAACLAADVPAYLTADFRSPFVVPDRRDGSR
jgi:hypothetical protein